MASYGYGFGSSQSQGYSSVHPQSSYTAQASSAYGNSYGGTGAPRQMVQQGYDAGGGYGFGYGRQQDNQSSAIPSSHQTTYGTSSYMSRDGGGYDASKSSYGYGSSSQGSYMYGNQGMKQTGSYGGSSMYGSGQYGSNQSKQPSSQSFMSQTGSTSAGYVGYGSVRSQAGASGGYSSGSQTVSAGGYSVSSQATAANNGQQKPRQVISKPQPHQGQQQQSQNQSAPNTYETVILNAATSFLSQQGQQQKPPWQRQQKPQFRLHNERRPGPRAPQQLHYCEVCKISCAGPMTYKEHLEGQKHKKKAASQVTTSKEILPSGSYKCELCDVTCTGLDAYDAHLKGARHVKTVKLHQKLGKPIPDFKTPEQITAEEKKATNEAPKKVIQRPASKATTSPKINFVGGTKLVSTESGSKETEIPTVKADIANEDDDSVTETQDGSKEIVGEEYIEDLKSDVGKVIGYKCTLCDCRFNDMVARTAHVKGRRHRLSYKKKVQPSLRVDMKGSKFQNRMQRGRDSGDRRAREQEMMWRARQQVQVRWEQELRIREEELRRWEEEEYLRKAEEDRYWTRPDHRNMHELEHYELERRTRYFEPHGGRGEGPNPLTPDDRLVMAKHKNIYPTEAELKQVQNVVGTTEKALKLVSDQIADEDQKAEQIEPEPEVKKEEEEDKVEVKTEDGTEKKEKTELPKPEPKKPATKSFPRTLKGVMRVGVLAKGLLLHEQLDVELVVLCNDKPTTNLLNRVADALPERMKQVSDDTFDITVDEANGSITVATLSEPSCRVEIKLTSPVMREDTAEEEKEEFEATSAEGEVLNKEKCLEALASLRHAKWFQARANGVQFCVIIIRIMRDLCTRIPAFQVFSGWAIELLVEKALSSGPSPAGVGEAFRRVLEVISSGIFLPGSCGLLDPCEKEKTDAAGDISDQEREDLTAGAQHALRLHAFRQLHTVLDIEPLKPPQRGRGHGRAKRRRDDSRDSASKGAGAKMQKKDDEKAEVTQE